jgi:sphinganine-1-phosphate aldolase
MQKKVTTEMGKARLDIENKLVPKGPNVTRHLALPDDGKSLEWILAEMEKMDVELNGQSGIWNQGKLSGAVYRAFHSPFFDS